MTKKKQVLIRWKKSSNDFICYRREITSEVRLMYKLKCLQKVRRGGMCAVTSSLDSI